MEKNNLKVVKYKKEYYAQVNGIYEESFPVEERYLNLDKLIESLNTKLYCLVDRQEVLGFIYLINYENMIFILYLAINSKVRSNGYGRYLLKWCLEKYKDKKIYLNIDEVKSEFEDYEIRNRRLNFYLKNGFFNTNYISKEDSGNFNILSNNLEIDIDKYKMLDKKVAEILNEPISEILKI